MKILKVITLIICTLLLVLIGFLQYMGYFNHAVIEEKEFGGLTVAGMAFIGPYSKAGESIQKVNSKLKQLKVISTKGFGIYYDDPKTTPEEKCKSFVGDIIEQDQFSKINAIQSIGLKIDTIKMKRSIVSEFPLKNVMSYILGPMKVYPKLSEYANAKQLNVGLTYEIYDMDQKKIIFVMQCESQK